MKIETDLRLTGDDATKFQDMMLHPDIKATEAGKSFLAGTNCNR